MRRLIATTIIKMLVETIVLTMIVAMLVVYIGYTKMWDSSRVYSNAFFIAGALVIIAGAASRLAAGQDWTYSQRLPSESFRDLSGGDRANFIVNLSSSYHLVILGLLSGSLLILISSLVWDRF